jgi:hypothetical protein
VTLSTFVCQEQYWFAGLAGKDRTSDTNLSAAPSAMTRASKNKGCFWASAVHTPFYFVPPAGTSDSRMDAVAWSRLSGG